MRQSRMMVAKGLLIDEGICRQIQSSGMRVCGRVASSSRKGGLYGERTNQERVVWVTA
jgi:hypothetical protein